MPPDAGFPAPQAAAHGFTFFTSTSPPSSRSKKPSLFSRRPSDPKSSPPEQIVNKAKVRHSLSASVSDLGTSLRRSASLRSASAGVHAQRPSLSHRHKTSSATSSTASTRISEDSERPGHLNTASRPSSSRSTNAHPVGPSAALLKPPSAEPATRSDSVPQLLGMAAVSSRPPTRPGGSSYSNVPFGGGQSTFSPAGTSTMTAGTGSTGQQVRDITWQSIHDNASKRISTLDYLRKAHEGHLYWFNTLLLPSGPTSPTNQAIIPPTSPSSKYTPGDITLATLPSHAAARLARRATSYCLLGFSLPAILDLNSASAAEFLRALNALLSEFESYQTLHSETGGTSIQNSLGRAKVAGLFRRGVSSMGVSKGRRPSNSEAAGVSLANGADDKSASNGTLNSTLGSSVLPLGATTSVPEAALDSLLPGEEYQLLITPNLPFDPDFLSTFSTLCDTLIDVYTKLLSLTADPSDVLPGISEQFQKADTKIRKLLVQSIVREFEEESRKGVRREISGLGKVSLGGLM